MTWFEQRLADIDMILIFEIESTPIGMVRFSVSDTHATIGVIVAPGHRGKNYGAQIIALASVVFSKKHPATDIHAFIKKENIGSIKSFEKANFRFVKQLSVLGHSSVEMKYSND